MKQTKTKTKTMVAVAIAVIGVGVIMAVGMSMVSSVRSNRGSGVDRCANLWYHDSQSTQCLKKEFCGTYLYEGLKTFNSKKKCETSLSGKKNSCPQLSPLPADWCKNGKIISGVKDNNGCTKAPTCECGSCPQLSPLPIDWCASGKIIPGKKDNCGCASAPKCECGEACIQFSAPPSGWCEGGKIIPGGKDDCGCTKAPTCVMPNDSSSATVNISR